MTDKTWKANERRLAKLFGTVRNPLSGMNSGVTGSDTRHGKIFFDVKTSKHHFTQGSIIKKLIAIEEAAQKEEKIPVIVTHSKGSKEMTCWLSKINLDSLAGTKFFFLVGIDAKELAKLVNG